ncbi:MAG: aldo/keto reductase [Leadbetterella sp.]
MNYRQLGKSGLVVSELSLGAMTFGNWEMGGFKGTIDEKHADRIISKAMEHGVNFFDTADMYGAGQSEIVLGSVLKSKRQDAVIATKVAFRAGAQSFNAGIGTKHLIQQVDQSLKNLQTDYIDVLLLHNDDPITPIDETLKALENLGNSGKILHIGFSNFQAWKAATMIQRQTDFNYSPFVASQMHYSILNREVENEFIPMSMHHGVGMMVWSPLSSGFLTGKYTRQNPQPADGRLNSFDLGLFDRELGYTVIDKLTEIANKHNSSIIAVSIAWLLAKKVVSSVILGVSNESQLDANLEATSIKLSEEDVLAIDEISNPGIKYPKTFTFMQDQELAKAKRF